MSDLSPKNRYRIIHNDIKVFEKDSTRYIVEVSVVQNENNLEDINYLISLPQCHFSTIVKNYKKAIPVDPFKGISETDSKNIQEVVNDMIKKMECEDVPKRE